MRILKHSEVVVESLVLLAEPGEPELLRLIDPNHPEYEGWIIDWHIGNKFVLKRERRLTTTVPDQLPCGCDSTWLVEDENGKWCADCGKPLATMPICQKCKGVIQMAWAAPDDIWQAVSGYGPEGLLCPRCFDVLARSKGIILAWFVADEPKEDRHGLLNTKPHNKSMSRPQRRRQFSSTVRRPKERKMTNMQLLRIFLEEQVEQPGCPYPEGLLRWR